MRTQQSRDDKTVAIATALGIFVLLLAVGSALLWAISLSDPTNPMYNLVIAASAMAAVVYLVRHRKR